MKRGIIFEVLCDAVSELGTDHHGWLRAFLRDVERDVASWKHQGYGKVKKGQAVSFKAIDQLGERTLVVPANEPTWSGDPTDPVLDLEARTRTRLRNGENPNWFLRLYHDFQECSNPADRISFAEYVQRRHPDKSDVLSIESAGQPSKRIPTPDKLIAIAKAARRLIRTAGETCCIVGQCDPPCFPDGSGAIEMLRATEALEREFNPRFIPFDANGRRSIGVTGWPDVHKLSRALVWLQPTFSIFQCRSGLPADGSQCARANLRCQ
jgi:hypothetical protein